MGKKRSRFVTDGDDAALVRQFFSDDGPPVSPAAERKLKQLVRETYRVMVHALAELEDPRLASAAIVEVRPAPDASRLAVGVAAGGVPPDDVVAALAAAKGYLRDALAAALDRKRTPELAFEVLP